MTKDLAHVGKTRLMLMLADLCQDLRRLFDSHGWVQKLCEAHEEACLMRLQLENTCDVPDTSLLIEYRMCCQDIEEQIRDICSRRFAPGWTPPAGCLSSGRQILESQERHRHEELGRGGPAAFAKTVGSSLKGA